MGLAPCLTGVKSLSSCEGTAVFPSDEGEGGAAVRGASLRTARFSNLAFKASTVSESSSNFIVPIHII